MNIVDSSGWLEYLADTPNASYFAEAIEDVENLLVPSIILFEVLKKLTTIGNNEVTQKAMFLMNRGNEVPLDHMLAVRASQVSVQYRLPLADSIIYTITVLHNAILLTQDSHFAGLPNVRYFEKH